MFGVFIERENLDTGRTPLEDGGGDGGDAPLTQGASDVASRAPEAGQMCGPALGRTHPADLQTVRRSVSLVWAVQFGAMLRQP